MWAFAIHRTLKIFTFKSSSLEPLNQIKPNLTVMILGRFLFIVVSASLALRSRWLPSLKISTNKIDHHDITDILLKMVLNIITLTLTTASTIYHYSWQYILMDKLVLDTCTLLHTSNCSMILQKYVSFREPDTKKEEFFCRNCSLCFSWSTH